MHRFHFIFQFRNFYRLKKAGFVLYILVSTILVIGVFFYRFTPARVALFRLINPITAAFLILAASLALGRWLWSLTRHIFSRFTGLNSNGEDIDPFEATLIGVPLFGTLLGIIAWFGFFVELFALLISLFLAVAGLLMARRVPWKFPRISFLITMLLLPPIILAVVQAITPVASPDELVYKLAIPMAYKLWGGMVHLPLNSHSYFTMALSMTSFGALILSNALAAKLVHLGIYLFSLRAIKRMADRVEPGCGIWTAVVYAWTPALAIIAGWAWSEWALIGLLALSWDTWERFQENHEAGSISLMVLALAGAVAIKYNALLWLALFSLLVFLGLRKTEVRSLKKILAVCAFIVAIFGGFFYLRNFAWTGSPFAPFLLPAAPAISGFRSAGHSSGWADLIHGIDIVQPGMLDDSLGILIPLSALLAIISLWGKPKRWTLFGLGIIQYLAITAFAPMSRLSTIALLPLVVLGSTVVLQIWKARVKLIRVPLILFAAIALSAQMILTLFVFVKSYDFMDYLVGRENATQNMLRTRPYTRIYDWIGRNTPEESIILVIGENQTYGLPRRYLAAGNLDGSRMNHFLDCLAASPSLEKSLLQIGVTHILIHPKWIILADKPHRPLEPLERVYIVEITSSLWRTIQTFLLNRSQIRYQGEGYQLFELKR
jgi:hypothetical protein